jgi:flagellum-specific peptidoglycan hydrolase FlgJ
MKRIIYIVVLSVLVSACGSIKKIVTQKDKPKTEVKVVKTTPKEKPKTKDTPKVEVKAPVINNTTEYIALYKDIAMEEMRKYGIPASITLAQGILESGSGKGRLAVKANNHFGIKCHGWKGAKIYHDDDKKQECFRKYNNAKYSFKDHSEFLSGRSRYASLFDLRKDDYKAWAKGLRKAGYATDKKYPEKLISLIERYNLDQYDDKVLGSKAKRPKELNKAEIITHKVVKGETLYSISRKYNITVEELQKMNGLTSNNLSIGQVLNIKTSSRN